MINYLLLFQVSQSHSQIHTCRVSITRLSFETIQTWPRGPAVDKYPSRYVTEFDRCTERCVGKNWGSRAYVSPRAVSVHFPRSHVCLHASSSLSFFYSRQYLHRALFGRKIAVGFAWQDIRSKI